MNTSRSMHTCSSLYAIIKNALPLCSAHNKVCQLYDQTKEQFTCQECSKARQHCVNVNDILLNSTLLMKDQTKKQSSTFLSNHLVNLAKLEKTYRKNNQMLDEYFDEIQKQMKKYIKRIKDDYRKMQQSFIECGAISVQLREVCSTYNKFLIQQLENEFQEGTTTQLLSIFKRFSTINQDPFTKIQQKISQLALQMQRCCNIDWKHIQKIYQKVSDPFLWQIDNILVPFSNYCAEQKPALDKIYLPHNPPASLSDFQYLIKASEKSIQLLKQVPISFKDEDSFDFQNVDKFQSRQIQGELKDSIQVKNIDMIYQLPERRLLAISYDKLQFFNYKFSQLVKEKDIWVSGCTQVLIFEEQIVLLANQKIYKIRYKNGSKSQGIQIVDSEYCSIQYCLQDGKKAIDKFWAIYKNNTKKLMKLC